MILYSDPYMKRDLGKVVATIEARISSSRLPGKVLLPVLGKPIISYLIERLMAVEGIDDIVIATTTNPNDDVLVTYASDHNVNYFRGSEEDVLLRVINAAKYLKADTVIEITADCPIIDPELVFQALEIYRHNDVSYVTNGYIRSYPDGMDVSIFSLDSLIISSEMTTDPLHREHVPLNIVQNPSIFPPINILAPPSLHNPNLGLTLDELDDYTFLKALIEELYPTNPLFGCYDVLSLLRKKPHLLNLNSHVTRKGYT